MPSQPATPGDLFVVKSREDRYVLYAPLRRTVAAVNGAAARVVSRYVTEGPASVGPAGAPLIEALEAQGLLAAQTEQAPVFPADYAFNPIEVTLFPTSRCNLRCRYCYADAGRRSIEMPWEVARAAIDLVVTNAGRLGSRKFTVGFHGGGEPTMAWGLMRQAAEYAHQRSEETGLDVELFSATNGLLNKEQREYIAARFSSVTVSLDGPPDVQNFNRPTASGAGSFEGVRQTLEYFNEVRFPFWIRATVTASTVHRMEEAVEYLHAQFAVGELHMEPAWQCGRCATTGEEAPAHQDFARNFGRARAAGRRLGVNVRYSGSRLDVLTSKFCAAPGDGFSVLPEGVATSCFEVTEPDDPRAAIFHYGRFDPQTGGFAFDDERVRALRGLSVEHLPFCGDCFCKWHCAGDCLAKVFGDSGSAEHRGSRRCELNRALTLGAIEELLDAAEQPREGRN
jgi:uncharacterized protein